MSATTVPTQVVPRCKVNSARDQSHADTMVWLGRTLQTSEFALSLFDHAADRPTMRYAAERGCRQLCRNSVRPAAPLGRLDCQGQGADPWFGGDRERQRRLRHRTVRQ